MQFLNELTALIVDYIWGMPLLVFLLLANLILFSYSKFLPLKGFFHAIRILFEKKKNDEAKGQISHFQALTNALSGTIGLGNISGVSIAIMQGGPGAIFWMWLAAFLGMNTKFYECTLSVMYRGEDYKGEVQGGPMYVISQIWPGKGKFLAYTFALLGLFGTLGIFQINQLADFTEYNYHVPRYITGLSCALIVFIILKGGILRISQVTSKLVPLMGIIYILTCLFILFLHIEKIPLLIQEIFSMAFTGKSVIGGVVGYSVKEIMITGIKRATFSNEAGLGTAPMAHSNAKTNEPVKEGYVAMLGPFLDTIVVCTLTSLTVLVVDKETSFLDSSGIILTTHVFENALGIWGRHLLGISVLLFSFTTIIGMANYNEKCWNFVFKGKRFFQETSFIFYFCLTVLFGAIMKMDIVINLMDICYGLMTVPNIIIMVFMAKEVTRNLKMYNKKYDI